MRKFDTIFELLTYKPLRDRPEMWVGSSRISDFWYFLNGFSFSEKEHDYFMKSFSSWIAKHYGLSGEASLRWDAFIMINEEMGEEAALKKFFELCDVFREISPKSDKQKPLI